MPEARSTIVPYGRAKVAAGEIGEPAATLAQGRALRLSDGPYPFDEPPDLIGLATRAQRLALLSEHLQSLCGVWDRSARIFVDAYFHFIAAAIAEAGDALAARAAATGGLFEPEDWSFAALRPLPQAHLDAGTARVRVDFAFWTGATLVVIELQGGGTPRRQRQDELQHLAAAGVTIVAVPGGELQRAGAALLARILPAPFQRFWADVSLPRSPFAPQLLDAILPPEGDQSVISST